MKLKDDECRCHDDDCGEHEQCERWLQRASGTNHAVSLVSYDLPLGSPCPLRIAPEPAKRKAKLWPPHAN